MLLVRMLGLWLFEFESCVRDYPLGRHELEMVFYRQEEGPCSGGDTQAYRNCEKKEYPQILYHIVIFGLLSFAYQFFLTLARQIIFV